MVQAWDKIRRRYAEYAHMGPAFAGMLSLVDQIESSEYAELLFAWTSMHDLCLSVMTIEEVLDSLPNGLHDAHLRSIQLDYAERAAQMHLDIWVGNMSLNGEAREARRSVMLQLSGLWYFVVEAPDPKYDFHEPNPLWIDAGVESLTPEVSSVKLPAPPEGTFAFWIYVRDWNAFIHVAAMHADVT